MYISRDTQIMHDIFLGSESGGCKEDEYDT
jgi:hypothetical protein